MDERHSQAFSQPSSSSSLLRFSKQWGFEINKNFQFTWGAAMSKSIPHGDLAMLSLCSVHDVGELNFVQKW